MQVFSDGRAHLGKRN